MAETSQSTTLPALMPGEVAVITGAASGIGLAAATRLAAMGMKIVMADRETSLLDRAAASVAALAAGGAASVVEVPCDVSRQEDMQRLADTAYEKFGKVSLLMNNAGIGSNPGQPWENFEAWQALIDVNFWGVVRGVDAFVPRMLAAGIARHRRQHRLQAGHHHAARQPCLQCLQGGAEDLHRGAGACAAQHAGRARSARIC